MINHRKDKTKTTELGPGVIKTVRTEQLRVLRISKKYAAINNAKTSYIQICFTCS